MAPEDALQQVLAYTREVSGCSSNAIIAAKYVVEEKQELDEEEFALRFTKDEEKDVEMVPRRALSMNHLSSRGVRSTPRIDTNLKPDLVNISENEAMNSPPSPAVHHSVNSTPTSPSVKEEMEENLDEKKASKKKKSLLSIKILSQSAPARRITVDSPISASSKLSKFFGEDMSRNVVTPVDDEWFLSEDIDDQDVLYSMEGNLKGASLPALIVKLTHHGKLDPQLTQAFIMTFHSFTTSREVITQLIARYNVNPPEGLTDDELRIWQERKQRPIRLRVFNVFKLWLESHYFHPNDVSALDAIQSFALSAKESMPTIAEHILKIIEKRRVSADIPIRKLTAVSASSKDLPTPILPRNLKRIRLSDLNSMELARQLTIMESRVYNNIMPYECLDKAWSQKDSLERSPHVKKMIMMTNQITGWVAENILLERDIKQRAQLMKFFISVGDKCRQLHNFNTLMAILAALNSSPIHRLKRTRELLPTKYKAILEEMKQLMQPAQNFSSYRTELRSASPPCVPFLGLYLTDLTFIEDGNSNNIKAMPHMINVDKRIKVAEKIRELMQYQVPQNLMEVPEIQDYLHRELGDGERDADDLYEMSLQLEPREREDEKIARLLQESGFL
jgi:son of sevenless-like protein